MSAKVLELNEVEKAPFVIELNHWKMKDFRTFINAVTEQKWEEVYPLISQVVTSWPFDGSPSDASVIENLGLLDLATVFRAVNMAVSQAFTQGN
jgi:GDP-D-mannose dehydratase